MSNSAERRAHERHDTSVRVHGSPDEGGAVARMVTRNLSLGGLYCTSTTDFPEMARLAVRLMLPHNGDPAAKEVEPVDVEAVVVRREEIVNDAGTPHYDLALYFTSVDDRARRCLERYLERPATQPV